VTAFTASVTAGSGVSYVWNFGDGNTATGATVTHSYASVGSYTARVTATNSAGSVVATTPVTITDVPISGLSATNSSPTQLGNATAFTASVTAGSGVSYVWNFGDGNTATGATVAHSYASVGSYTARVTATNSAGSVVATTPVTITDVPVSGLSFTTSPTPTAGVTTFFTATIVAGTNVTYTWSFGDGSRSTGNPTSHTYATLGTYTVVVTATNGVSTVTITRTLTVASPIIVLPPTQYKIYLPLITR
jgi:PKD repeat protein